MEMVFNIEFTIIVFEKYFWGKRSNLFIVIVIVVLFILLFGSGYFFFNV